MTTLLGLFLVHAVAICAPTYNAAQPISEPSNHHNGTAFDVSNTTTAVAVGRSPGINPVNHRSWTWKSNEGSAVLLPTITNHVDDVATAVNDAGTRVAGKIRAARVPTQLAMWNMTSRTVELGTAAFATPGDSVPNWTFPEDVNDHELVAGWYWDENDDYAGFLNGTKTPSPTHKPDGTTDPGLPAGTWTYAVSNSGYAVGGGEIGSAWRAARWKETSPGVWEGVVLTPEATWWAEAYDVAEDGTAVGFDDDGRPVLWRAVHTPDQPFAVHLDERPEVTGYVHGISPNGKYVVGELDGSVPFVWQTGDCRVTVLAPGYGGAREVNDHGMIVGWGASGPVFWEKVDDGERPPECAVCNEESLDSDGDALPDCWETDGVDIDLDGEIEIDLKAMGADPTRRDVFVWIDWMAGEWPGSTSLDLVQDAFRTAPTGPNGQPAGIELHYEYSDVHATRVSPLPKGIWREFNQYKAEKRSDATGVTWEDNPQNSFGGLCGFPPDSLAEARCKVFHYVLFVGEIENEADNVKRLGRGELHGNDFIIARKTTVDEAPPFADLNLAGVFMHELGHNLGLDHGGGDDVNCKPNYVSVMSYVLMTPAHVPHNWSLDYSRAHVDLDEWHLNESEGISEPFQRTVMFSAPQNGTLLSFTRNTRTQIDWDGSEGNPNLMPTNPSEDTCGNVNSMSGGGLLCPVPVGDPLEPGTCPPEDSDEAEDLDYLHGHDDWAHLKFNFRESSNYLDAVHITPSTDATSAIISSGFARHPDDLAAAVENLPDSAFSNSRVAKQRRSALLAKVEAVDRLVDEGEIGEAIDKLWDDLRAKADGHFGGHEKNDWIVDRQAQESILTLIDRWIALLEYAQ